MQRALPRLRQAGFEHDDDSTEHDVRGMEGPRGALRSDTGRPPARPLSRRSRSRRAAVGRGGGDLPRLLEEPRHRRDAARCCCSSPSSRGLRERIDAMFRGDKINVTENRAVLHVALRAPRDAVDRRRRRQRRARGARGARPDERRSPTACAAASGMGHTGKRITQRRQHRHRRLGPRAGDGLRGAAALQRPRDSPSASSRTSTAPTSPKRCSDLDPAETLFIVSSKTFTTLETMTNAHTARDWSLAGLGGDERRSPSTSSRCRPTPRRWRSSASTRPTCSGSGTGSAVATRWIRRSGCRRCSRSGPRTSARCSPAFTRWTSTSAPRRSTRNLPVLMGLLDRLVRRISSARQTVAVLPYEQYLKRFPAYLQQLDDGEQRQAA